MGYETILFDPIGDPTWPTQWRYRDIGSFMQACESAERCALFIDESGEAVGQYDRDHWRIATRYAHRGHFCHFIAQRAQQVAVTARDQTERLYAFRLSFRDAKILAEEYQNPDLEQAARLGPYEYLTVERFGGALKVRKVQPYRG